MKILVLTMRIGESAPGIVFERLLYGLSKSNTVDVVTPIFSPEIKFNKNQITITIVKYYHIYPRLLKLFISIFNINPIDYYWSLKVKNKIKSISSLNYDYVFSLVSFNHYGPLIAGVHCSRYLKCKHVSYLVDAIPAPIGWLKKDCYYTGIKLMFTKYLNRLNALFSSNEQMLNYQINTCFLNRNVLTGVIYSPSLSSKLNFPKENSTINYFIYTGGLYGPRDPQFVIKAFIKILHDFPNSKLIFVGSQLSDSYYNHISLENKKKIEIHPFTRNLSPYYFKATALIDIDAYLKNDIFLSSKIVNYIFVNRIIISETNLDSPSRSIFAGINSIFQCNHDSMEIYHAMLKAINLKDVMNYEDRHSVQNLFHIDEVMNKLNSVLISLK